MPTNWEESTADREWRDPRGRAPRLPDLTRRGQLLWDIGTALIIVAFIFVLVLAVVMIG